MDLTKTRNIAMAVAAAGMFASAPTVAFANTQSVELIHCYGVNNCKGHNDCKTAKNNCKGQGKCKGQSFVAVPKSACNHLGGRIKA